jgi:hypothetical protein
MLILPAIHDTNPFGGAAPVTGEKLFSNILGEAMRA